MSHSPQASQDHDALAEYRRGWQATSKLLREGKSFSGHERNCVYLNCPGSDFANVSAVSGLDFPDDGRAVCFTDWDHDGDVDVWFHNRTGPRLRLMRNRLHDPNRGSPSGNRSATHFVAVRLRGTVSNRDAIGARVTVWQAGDTRPLAQTLHAGDAFLSQSSKWLHFGLGENERLERIVVRWPTGIEQVFVGIEADRRYVLTEGDAVADRLPIPDRPVAMVDADQPTVLDDSQVRTVMSNRLPLPLLPYETLAGEERTIRSTTGAPQLVVLWASWCPACRGELSELTKHADALLGEGVETLLIAVDGIAAKTSSDGPGLQPHADVRQAIQDLQLPFDVGLAKADLLEKLDLAETVLLNRSPPMAVPLNLLIDCDGALAAIYRGTVDVDALIADVQRLATPVADRRDQAIPLAGRWTNPPRQMLLRAVGNLFAEHGFQDDHARYLRLDAEVLEQQRRLATSPEQRRQLDSVYAAANYNLGVIALAGNQNAQALDYFQRAVEVNPRHVDAMVNLAVLHAKQRSVRRAISLLQRAVELDPDSIAARSNLAHALSATGAFEQAIDHYIHIVRLGSANALIHSRLARALIETGRVAEGAEQLEQAISSGARDAATLVSLAWIRATSIDPSLRDGDGAAALVTQLQAERLGPPAAVLDIAGAARAEQGDFAAAVNLASQALELVDEHQTQLRKVIGARIQGYRQSVAFRDADGRYP